MRSHGYKSHDLWKDIEGSCYGMLWTLTIFILFFLILYGFCFSFVFLLDDEEAHDTEVT